MNIAILEFQDHLDNIMIQYWDNPDKLNELNKLVIAHIKNCSQLSSDLLNHIRELEHTNCKNCRCRECKLEGESQ